MLKEESDLVYVFYILIALCLIGLIYIFIMIIAIAVITSKYNIKEIQRKVDIKVKYENDKRIYEKRENVTINKANKTLEEICHLYKGIDKTNPKQNLLLETIVEINDIKEYSDKDNAEKETVVSNSHNSGDEYMRESFEKMTKISKFDSNGKVINEFKTMEVLEPIEMIEPLVYQIIKSDIIFSKIPIKVNMNRIEVRYEAPVIEDKSVAQEKTVLDVVSYSGSTAPALLVSSENNETIAFIADIKPVLTSDKLISNVKFKGIKALVNNIDIKEIPTIASQLKIQEVPVFLNQMLINERRGPSEKSNSSSIEEIEAEVPIIVEKILTKRKIPSLVPISIQNAKILKNF